MLSSDPAASPLDAPLNATMTLLAQRLAETQTPDAIADDTLAQLFAATVRLYAARCQRGDRMRPFGPGGHDVTATDVMIATTAMLQAVNVQLFELGMWQAWTGSHALPAKDRAMNEMRPGVRDPSAKGFDTRTLMTHAVQQAERRRYHEFMIVDVDAHHYEADSYAEIIEFIEDPVLRQLAQYTKGRSLEGQQGPVGFQEMAGRITRYPGRRAFEKQNISTPPHRDITLTKRWMDALGVDIACMFPTPMLALALHPQVEAEVGLARAYNRWLCDKILTEEPRIKIDALPSHE